MSENTEPFATLIQIEGQQKAFNIALKLLQQANRSICFLGPELDKVLFDNDDAVALISQLARNSRFSQIRFAVYSTRRNISESHRVLALANKLTSSIEIRQCAVIDQQPQRYFLIVDRLGYLACQNPTRYSGVAQLQNRAKCRFLQQQFDAIWARAEPDPNIRRLNL